MKKTSLKNTLKNLKFRNPQSFKYHINADIKTDNKKQVIEELKYIIDVINMNVIPKVMGGESESDKIDIRFVKWGKELTY
jgi:hypothetical protein